MKFEDTIDQAYDWLHDLGAPEPHPTPLLDNWRAAFPGQLPPPLLIFIAKAERGDLLNPVERVALLMLDATPYSKEGWTVLMEASRRIVDE